MRSIGRIAPLLAMAIACAAALPATARAEQRLYLLHVTTRDGLRYETLSSEDPFTYASLVGGQIYVSRDYERVWSPQVKVLIVDSWIEHRVPLRDHWIDILKERGLHANHNYRLLPRRRTLTDDEMRVPERPPATLGTTAAAPQ